MTIDRITTTAARGQTPETRPAEHGVLRVSTEGSL